MNEAIDMLLYSGAVLMCWANNWSKAWATGLSMLDSVTTESQEGSITPDIIDLVKQNFS